MMGSIIQYYVKLALLQAQPQDMPASYMLQKMLILFYFIFVVINTLAVHEIWQSVLHGAIDLAMLALFTYLLLKDKKQRFNQAFNALLGVSLMIGIVHALVSVLFSIDVSSQEIPAVAQLIFFIIFIWVVIVYGHIIKHAVEINMPAAISISLIYIVLNVLMLLSISQLLKT